MNQERSLSFWGPIVAIAVFLLTIIIFFAGYTIYNRLSPGAEISSSDDGGMTAALADTPQSAVSPAPTGSRAIDLTTADGVDLKATYYPSLNGTAANAPALLLLHMAYSNRAAWESFAGAAQAEGYNLLAMDLRGHGESGGEQRFDESLDRDVDAALSWLNTQSDVDDEHIGIVGASVGASAALRSGAKHANIRSVAALSPGLNTWDFDMADALAAYGNRPILLVTSEEDEYPTATARELDAQALGEHRLKIYPGSAHGTDIFEAQPGLSDLLLAWFTTTLYLPITVKQDEPSDPVSAGPKVEILGSNLAEYADEAVPRYEKFELTFTVDTVAANLQLPYDAAPPPGIAPEVGVTVNGLFSPDNWQTVYTQPAFYYQEFDHQLKDGQDWLYPTEDFVWKLRFSPDQPGDWQYRLVAQDAQGTTETAAEAFAVVPSDAKGFVRVSQDDPRYFETDNGDYFAGLGYNSSFALPSWTNPVVENQPEFEQMSQNNLQLLRVWISAWGIYGSAWNPWNAQRDGLHSTYIPYTGTTFEEALPQSEVSMRLDTYWNECMFIGMWKARPAVKQDARYRVRIRYKTGRIDGPRISGEPYGLVAKTGNWLWGDGNYCNDPGTGTVVTPYQSEAADSWQILEGEILTGGNNFLPNFFLVMENADFGEAYIDYVWIEEDLGDGTYGPNIVSKPWMAHHLYFEQRSSYAFDKVLELAEANDVYLKLVALEKNEWILNRFDYDGNPIPDVPECWDDDENNNPEKCPGNEWFYGNGRQTTKVRWLQQSWWRYLQARWGYSPHIHSWELLNEGDPGDSLHYTLADEFVQYMHQFAPNDHLVTTSFWHSFPGEAFWANPEYSNLDYADLHAYAEDSVDTADNSWYYSNLYGANQPEGAGKPLIRGETGFSDEVLQDTKGIWLHNYIWAGVNPGGMVELYWYSKEHIVQPEEGNDLRYHYRTYNNFIEDIPLNNGNYRDAEAVVSNDNLRVWGQKDLNCECAHLWLQNIKHTWKNVVDGNSIRPASGEVTISGFQPGKGYTLEWWDTYQTDKTLQITGSETIKAGADGSIVFQVDNLADDVAVKIRPN